MADEQIFDWEIKRNDFGEIQPLEATLEEEKIEDGEVATDEQGEPIWEPVDLTGKTVRILAEDKKTKATIKTAPINVVGDPKAGGVQWVPESKEGEEAADTAVAGEYEFEFEITGADGLRTIPRNAYYKLKIWEDLGP